MYWTRYCLSPWMPHAKIYLTWIVLWKSGKNSKTLKDNPLSWLILQLEIEAHGLYLTIVYLKSLPTLDFSASTPTTHLSFKAWLKTQGTCTGWDLVHKWRNEVALFGQCGPTQSHLVLKFVCLLSLEKSCSFSRVLPASCPENHNNNNNNRSSAKWCAWQQHLWCFFSKGKWHSGSRQTIRGVARQRVTPLKLRRSKEPFVAKLWLIVISTKKKGKRAAKAYTFTWEQDDFDLFFYFPSLGIFKKTWWIWHWKII